MKQQMTFMGKIVFRGNEGVVRQSIFLIDSHLLVLLIKYFFKIDFSHEEVDVFITFFRETHAELNLVPSEQVLSISRS